MRYDIYIYVIRRLKVKDRQCTYNVTMRRARVTIVAMEKATRVKYYEWLYSFLSYTACKALAP